jgi:glycosyltransferase involved in cell wall biosynthesis
MMHLFINALAASAGGGLTYVRNVVPHIAQREDVRATILLEAQLGRELQPSANITFLERCNPSNAAFRFATEQRTVPALIRQCGADVLLSTGNFAVLRSPVPQILLSRNALYTSRDFNLDLRRRGDYRLWLDTAIKAALAKWSIGAADSVIAPSEAFAQELRLWTGRRIAAIHHGFDKEAFFGDSAPLTDDLRSKLDSAHDAVRLSFVSHYNYYRNFETLLRAMPLIKQKLHPRKVMLFLTCDLKAGANRSGYRSESAGALVQSLGIADSIVELGAVPYRQLHHVYANANIYVTAAYAESFAHPLVEAMASGLPIIASDLPVHREICGQAALYFTRFSARELAENVVKIADSSEIVSKLSERGRRRSLNFSWKLHVEKVLAVAKQLDSK